MADNVAITAGTGTTIAADDVSGVLYQRVKITVGPDGTANDVSSGSPIPIYAPDASVSGTISATDAVLGTHGGAGVLLTGTPTASSYVALALTGGESGFVIQLSGTFGSGTVWFECSADATTATSGNWTTLSCRVLGTVGSTVQDSVTVAGLYRGNASGMAYIRVRVTGATTPSIAVVLRGSDAVGPVAMNTPLVAGTNVIGRIGPMTSSTGTLSSVTGTASANTTLLASNTGRLGATFFNDSAAVLYLSLATTASTTSYTVQVAANGYYEVPTGQVMYTGIVTGVWSSATGAVRVTELT